MLNVAGNAKPSNCFFAGLTKIKLFIMTQEEWDNPIVKKIREFRIDINKSANDSNSRVQVNGLNKTHDEIIKFLKSELKTREIDSIIINALVAKFNWIKKEYIKHEFNKDINKSLQEHSKRIINAKEYIEAELSLLQDYVLKGDIIMM